MTTRTKARGRRIALIVGMVVLATAAFQGCVYRFNLGYAPQGLGVWRILYNEGQTWGFGPGGNETGVMVFALPSGAARAVERGGADYLNRVSPPERRHDGWLPTPVTEGYWLESNNIGDERPAGYRPQLADYLDKYGFGIAIDEEVVRLANEAMQEPGSYYAYDRTGGGLLLVSPRRRRVVFAYAG